MTIARLASLLLAGCASAAAISAAGAGGFDRGGVNIDLLFDPSDIATEAGVTYVSPQRTIRNVDRPQLVLPPIVIGPGPTYLPSPPKMLVTKSIDVEGDYTVPRLGAKMNLSDPVDCLATYTEPYGADSNYGTNNAYSPSAVEFRVDTRDFGLTCSYKMQVGKGFARVIGGVSYQEVDAFLSRQTLLEFGNTGIGTFTLSDDAWSWRVGAAYEIPEIGFRASLVYSARYNLNLTGKVDSTGFGPVLGTYGLYPNIPINIGVDEDAYANTEIPQALELRMQSGIAPDWLAFGSIRWQDWSKMQVVSIHNVTSPIYGPGLTDQVARASFDALYRDGWTVTGGVGHKFNDRLSGAASLTWDRGTSTTTGYQTDSWTVGVGGSFSPNKNVELKLGGSIGFWAAGESAPSGGDNANNVSYNFDQDLIFAGTAAVKIKF